MMEKLNNLVKLAKKATGGEWMQDLECECPWNIISEDGGQVAITQQRTAIRGNPKQTDRTANAAFIATANPATILAIAVAFQELEQRAETAEAKLAELEKQGREQKPFMYGIMTANGDAHFEEFCVSSNPSLLEDEIWEWNNSLAENEPKNRVVALFTHPEIKED